VVVFQKSLNRYFQLNLGYQKPRDKSFYNIYPTLYLFQIFIKIRALLSRVSLGDVSGLLKVYSIGTSGIAQLSRIVFFGSGYGLLITPSALVPFLIT